MLVRPTRNFPGTAFTLRGTALSEIWPWLIVLLAWSFFVTTVWWSRPTWLPDLTPLPFSLIGLALSIFLGFRNNACYDRWWEARKLWGRLINTSRSLTRQILILPATNSPDPAFTFFQREAIRRVAAYAYALKAHLRKTADPENLERLLPPDDLAEFRSSSNPPFWLTTELGHRFHDAHRRGWLDTYHLAVLDKTLTDLTDIQGGCERIKNTPVPLSYTVLTHRIVGLYCMCLPLGVVSDIGIYTPVVTLIVSFAFLGLDGVGTQLEDPFEEDPNDLPLAQISRMIEINVRETIDEEAPPPVTSKDGILL